MEVFITHDESSPPVPFHLAASEVIIVSTPLRRRDELEPHYASIRIHCVNMFVNKEILHIIHNKQITLYFFHKSCPIESRVRSFNNSPKCMIKIFLESNKYSHKAGVTKHVTNSMALKSLFYHL